MRVLMVAERLPPAIGGVERHVAGLTRVLSESGHEVTLVAPAHVAGLPPEGKIAGGRVLRIPRANRTRRDYWGAWRWWASRRSIVDRADVVHFHEVYSLLHWFGPARLLRPSQPSFLTYHGYEMCYPVPLRARLYRRLAARLVRDYIAVGSYLARWFRLRPKFVTYGAVTPPQSRVAPATPQRAVFIGRLAHDTGIDIYLRGLGILRRQHGRVLPLTVCGDGPLREEMELLAAQESIDATFVGLAPDPAPYLSQAGVAFASGYLAMLEAMAHRRPVLGVYHTPVKADYLQSMPGAGETFVTAGSPLEVADQLDLLLSGQRDPNQQIEAAFQFAADQSWSRLAQMYLDLWESA